MPSSNPPIDESSFFHFAANDADRIPPRQALRFVSDLPRVSGDFANLRNPS
jgi:hypothetical protein